MAEIGRPTKYKEEFCQLAEDLLSQGKSLIHLAKSCGVHRDSIHEWRKKHPSFSDSVKKGLELSELWWMDQAQDNLHSKTFNAVLWYMNMKNRFGWADKKEVKQEIGLVAEEVKEVREARKAYEDSFKKEY